MRLTVSQPVSLGVESHLGLMTRYLLLFDSYSLFSWGALFNEGMGLYFVYAAGPCQRSLSRVRVPLDSRQYFTVSDLRLPFSSPPTSRRVMVEVFDPASTRVCKLPSPSHIATDGQSVCLSWCRARLWLMTRFFSFCFFHI
jgi:hypothetical protein